MRPGASNLPGGEDDPFADRAPSDPPSAEGRAAPNAGDGEDDAALLTRARAGESDAFAELWRTNVKRARTQAQHFPSLDADDLVAEAFVRVMAIISRGGGPDSAFGAYLATTVRHLAGEWGRAPRPHSVDDPGTLEDESLWAPSSATIAESRADGALVAEVFGELPERWRTALWLSEVEGMKPRQIAPQMKLSANAISALLVRARRGFRDAWIARHLTRATSEQCAKILERIVLRTRNVLSDDAAREIDAHLPTCENCRRAAAEARAIATGLIWAALPALVGGAALAYRSLGAPAVAQALDAGASSASMAGGSTAVGSTAVGGTAVGGTAVGGTVAVSAVKATVVSIGIGAGATALLAATALAIATLVQPLSSLPVETPLANASPTQDSSAAEPALPPPTTTPVTNPSPPPAGDTTDDPRRSPQPNGAAPGTGEAATPPAASAPPAPPVSAPIAAPLPTDAGAEAGTDADSDADAEAEATGPATESTPIPTPITTPPLIAPTLIVDADPSERLLPILSGSHAEAAAVIEVGEVVAGTLRVMATTTALSDGTWSISELSDLRTGTTRLAARQISAGRTSTLGTPVTVTIQNPPALVIPFSGSRVLAAGLRISFTGDPGASVQRIVNGVPRTDLMNLDEGGRWSGEFTTSRGEVELGLRYFDPTTGRFGPTFLTLFTAE